MSNMKIMTLNVALVLACAVLFVVNRHLSSKSMLSATRDGAELVGKSVEEIFFRTPIIPDEIHMGASSDSVIALVFCQETINGVKYPERVLYLKNGIVVRAITDGEVATEHD